MLGLTWSCKDCIDSDFSMDGKDNPRYSKRSSLTLKLIEGTFSMNVITAMYVRTLGFL